MIDQIWSDHSAELRELYQSAILEQSKHPYGKICDLATDDLEPRQLLRDQNPNGVITHQVNPSCGDELFLSIQIEKDSITQVKWIGSGCAISQASVSLMSQLLEKQSLSSARLLVKGFYNMLTDLDTGLNNSLEPKVDSKWEGLLGDAVVFYNVRNYPNRIKCALLSWMGAKTLLEDNSDD
jgi:nitrogen fixation NifU-like protein